MKPTYRALAVVTPTLKQPPIPGPLVTATKSGFGCGDDDDFCMSLWIIGDKLP